MYKENLCKGGTVYFARVIPSVGIYDLCELTLRTIREDYFVGIDKKEEHAFLFPYSDLGEIVFQNRKDALRCVKEAQENKTYVPEEIYYEEY